MIEYNQRSLRKICRLIYYIGYIYNKQIYDHKILYTEELKKGMRPVSLFI